LPSGMSCTLRQQATTPDVVAFRVRGRLCGVARPLSERNDSERQL
jgi:hypothetical protein